MARSARSPSTRLGARVGLFGGSFNPVHNGHIRLAEYALSELNLDRVLFVPSNRTPLKKVSALLPASLRLRCLRRALRGHKAFSVSTEELRRGGTSYTVDTLKRFRRLSGGKTTFYFLAGADAVKNLSRWKSPSEVIKLCRFTVFSRPGASRTGTPSGVCWADFPALDISSSQVRWRLERGRPLTGLVPAGTEVMLKSFKRKAVIRSRSKRS